ncbi:hypothetical protein Tco_0960931 [Tanacetum coccineum]
MTHKTLIVPGTLDQINHNDDDDDDEAATKMVTAVTTAAMAAVEVMMMEMMVASVMVMERWDGEVDGGVVTPTVVAVTVGSGGDDGLEVKVVFEDGDGYGGGEVAVVVTEMVAGGFPMTAPENKMRGRRVCVGG